MEEPKPEPLKLNDDFGTGTPGEFIFQPSGDVYLVKAGGNWEKLTPEMAALVRKEKGR